MQGNKNKAICNKILSTLFILIFLIFFMIKFPIFIQATEVMPRFSLILKSTFFPPS